MDIKQLREKSMSLPLSPGVYIMKNKKGEIIYIGKAKALKNRVSQYFGSQNTHAPKVRRMVENVFDFDYIITDSEFEALVLECSLIKQNMPKYNILLKDSKGYSYIKITKNPYGNVYACYRKDDDSAEYLGPYTGNFSVVNAVDEAKEIFKLPTCNKVFPRDIGKDRPCLNYHINKCSAPCARKISREDYEKSLAEAVNFLKSGKGDAVKLLKQEMLDASDNLDFERAAQIRDRLKCIERIGNRQKVVVSETKNMDVFAISQSSDKSCLAVLSFRDGLLCNTEHFIFDSSSVLPSLRHELIVSYYLQRLDIPSVVLVDGTVADDELLVQWLTEKRGKKVTVRIPERGDDHKLIQMTLSNASQKLGIYLGRKGNETAALDELAKALSLPVVPRYIESYDISHTDGADNVCGMIVFKDGRPFKAGYKKFKINSFSGQDDYGSMREVILRRFNRYLEEQGTDSTFAIKPDLILLDGGQGQVNAVKPILEALELDIPVFGMVKDNKHRTRAIASGGEEVHIRDDRPLFTLVSTIQEEVHRFAITFHKSTHTKHSLEMSLTAIPGIGEKKAKLLIKEFKSIKKIKEASVDEVTSVKGLGKKDFEAIHNYFNSLDNSQ